MAAPPELIRHGSLATPVLTAQRIRRRLDGLDEGQLVYMCAQPDVFLPGTACPGYPGLRIHEVDERAVAGDIEATLDVSGLKTGSSRRISLSWEEDPFGFDTANEQRIELATAADVAWGTALTGFTNMRYLGGAIDDELDGRYITRTLSYKGIRRTGLIHRRVTVNENIVSPSDPITVDLPDGWPSTARKSRVSLPRIVVVETLKSTTAPATETIPSIVTLPISGIDFPTIAPITPNPADPTWNYPFNWKVASLDSEQLYLNAAIYVHSYTYEYVWPKDF